MDERYIKVSEPLIGDDEIDAVTSVLRSGMYVSGKEVAGFEAEFADYIGVGHAVAVNSGTAALHLALAGAGIGPGDEVIVPAMTFFSTVTSVIHAGARPVFADVDENYCLDPESVARQLSSATRAILPVHYFGCPANLSPILTMAEERGLFVLEDCAQSIGSRYQGQRCGGIGQAGAFSFFATKNMTTGEGGMITTNDAELAERARLMRAHGLEGRDDHIMLGYNFRMTEMEAAMGRVQLRKLDEFNAKRREHSEYLYTAIEDIDWIAVQDLPKEVEHTYFWCPIRIDEDLLGMTAGEVRSWLHEQGIGTRFRYYEPLYRQPMLRSDSPYPRAFPIDTHCDGETLRFQDLRLPRAEAYSGRLLGLPNHPGLTRKDLDRIVQALHQLDSERSALSQNTKTEGQ